VRIPTLTADPMPLMTYVETNEVRPRTVAEVFAQCGWLPRRFQWNIPSEIPVNVFTTAGNVSETTMHVTLAFLYSS
jgi:hypothetical protein